MRRDYNGRGRIHWQRDPCRCWSRARRCDVRLPIQWGHRLHLAVDGYANGIVRLIGQSYGQQTVQSAWHEFNIGRESQPFCGFDINAELFYSWLFHKWIPAREEGHKVRDQAFYGVPPTRAYLDRHAAVLNPRLRAYLETCLSTSPRFYEVVDCAVGFGFRASDVLTDATFTVTEAIASTSLKKGDILYAHLVPMGEVTLMEAISPHSFPLDCKRRLLRLRKNTISLQIEGRPLREAYFALSAMVSSG